MNRQDLETFRTAYAGKPITSTEKFQAILLDLHTHHIEAAETCARKIEDSVNRRSIVRNPIAVRDDGIGSCEHAHTILDVMYIFGLGKEEYEKRLSRITKVWTELQTLL